MPTVERLRAAFARSFLCVNGGARACVGTDGTKQGLSEVAREAIWINLHFFFRSQRHKETLDLILLAGSAGSRL